MSIYIGCDLGGTNIKAGLVDVTTGEVILSDSIPTKARKGHEVVMERMATFIASLIERGGIARKDIGGVGVSAPGMLDLDRGLTLLLTNLPGQWRGVPLRDTLRSALGLPVALLNDARAITYGEFTYGAGKDVRDMVCFAIGTGIGGGVVVDNKLVLGINGTAGEIGHQTVDIDGPFCGCGSRGCLETYASGPAIASMAMKAVHQGRTTMIADLTECDLNKITPAVVAEAAKAGDAVAKEVWETAGYYLGVGIANVIVALAPQKVVLCGGVAAAGELLLSPVKRAVKERVFLIPIDEIEIVIGKLGNDAGIVGMATWAAAQAT